MKRMNYYNTILKGEYYRQHGIESYMITTLDELFLYNKIMKLINGESDEELTEEEWELFNKTFRKYELIEWNEKEQKFICHCTEKEWQEYEEN